MRELSRIRTGSPVNCPGLLRFIAKANPSAPTQIKVESSYSNSPTPPPIPTLSVRLMLVLFNHIRLKLLGFVNKKGGNMKLAKRLLIPILVSIFSIALFAAPAHAEGMLGAEQIAPPQVKDKGWCVPLKVPVAKVPLQLPSWKVAITYCQPFDWQKGQHQIDVLTHGATYTHTYWDWPQDPDLYSYVNKTLADGRAVLNYDRIGNGESTRPLSTEITMDSDAFVLNQLIQGLKLVGYKQINSVGHSYGSGVVVSEAATYKDVSRVVVTGYLHRPSNPAVTAGNYPANLDPKFAGLGLDNGWFTSRPGVRGTSFHSPSSDPAVVAYDEQQKDLVSLTGLLDFIGERSVPAANNLAARINVPVLSVTGQQDAIFCYAPTTFNCADVPVVTANETPFYAGAPSLKVVTIPESGHDLTLHPSASLPYSETGSYAVISKWIKDN